jgi:hypothetical protein
MRTRAVTLSDELVRAALDDRLGELVVPMRPQPGVIRLGGNPAWIWPPCSPIRTTDRRTWTIGCPLGAVGERLWGREAWNWSSDNELIPGEPATKSTKRAGYRAQWGVYRADGFRNHPDHPEWGRTLWRSALQMPRDLSRLTFEITALRCERLQHITGYGAQLSGFASVAEFRTWWDRATSGSKARAPRDGESWNENPWVFVASVRRVEVR